MLTKKKLIYVFLIILASILFILEKHPHFRSNSASVDIYPTVSQQPLSEIDVSFTQEIEDLMKIVYALEHYKLSNLSYPISSSDGKKWDGIFSAYGESREDWIRGLTPKYLDKLPRDPRQLDDGTRQYIYRSDGANYKLIVHRAMHNCKKVRKMYPQLIDPRRTCFAYGFWTDAASNW